MAEVIIMPKLGFNMSEGKLVEWYKQEGEEIKKGENLFSIETDKTNMDIEAIADGVVRKLLIKEGEQIPVTLPIAIIGSKDEDIEDVLSVALSELGKEPQGEVSAPTPTPQEATVNEAKISNRDFDILVIGGGPGGYVAAIKGAQLGKKVALIEKSKLGGTCLNVGCIPTKALLRSAEALKEVKDSAIFGVVDVDTSKAKLDMSKVQARKQNVIDQLVGGVGGLLRANGVKVVSGEAKLLDRNTAEVNGEKISSDYILIATGSTSKSLPIPINDKMEVLTSTEMLNLTKIPKNIAIIGGGVIGIEFAYFMASVGTKVTIIEFLDRILPMVDEEITIQAETMLRKMGIEIHTSAKITEITEKAVVFEKEGKISRIPVEKVLMSVGREPQLVGINCEELNIKMKNGVIWVDETLQTSVDNIYAIGDVNGKVMLAHTASMEGIVAVENICGHKSVMDYMKIPSAIYIQPEIASVGLTEKQAKEQYGAISVGRFPMVANGKSKVQGEETGIVKVITESRYGEIVGVHLFCIHATDMISEAVVTMKLEGTAEEIAMAVHPHPTVSEAIHEAMHAVSGKAIHFV